jgi:hypothetical protein
VAALGATVTIRARTSVVILSLAGLAGACAGPAPPPVVTPPAPPTASTGPTRSFSPTPTANPTPTASPSAARPSLPPGAPAIADPYWLLATGTSSGTWNDADGNVTRTDTSTDYTVIRGGGLEGTILVNGDPVALLSLTETELANGAAPGTDEAALLGLAGYDVPGQPRPTRDSGTITWDHLTFGSTRVVLRTVEDKATTFRSTMALWWAPDHEGWYQLSDPNAGIDLAPLVEAMLGPAAG